MSEIINIAKKELFRFFTDSRIVFTTILLPGLMIYMLYSFMGNAFSTMFAPDTDKAVKTLSINMPASISELAKQQGNMEIIEAESEEKAKEQVKNGEADLFIVFPDQFDDVIAAYESDSGLPAPNIALYYDSSSVPSSDAHRNMSALLDDYEKALTNKFDINRDISNADLAEKTNSFGQIMGGMLPFLLLIFLFSACMAIVPESIAGEKERGTIATLLVTPLKRSHLVIGKIFALGLVALCSGISSFVGTFLSLPKLFSADSGTDISLNLFTPMDYVLLFFVILATLFLLVSMISIISAYAKTVKEAATIVSPLMILVMLIGVTAIISREPKVELVYYLIPVYNSVQSMVGIFSMNVMPMNIIVAICSNLLYASICVVIISKMFNSEKIIFSR